MDRTPPPHKSLQWLYTQRIKPEPGTTDLATLKTAGYIRGFTLTPTPPLAGVSTASTHNHLPSVASSKLEDTVPKHSSCVLSAGWPRPAYQRIVPLK